MKKGRLFVLIGPSGVGKTTLAEKAQHDGLANRIITCTTRPPRPHEVSGQDYFFLTIEEFSLRQARDEFVENEWIHGNRYGVLIRELSQALESGHVAIVSLGYEGAKRVKALWPHQVTIVGILPPSLETLRYRLKDRGTRDSEITLRLREIDREAPAVEALADVIIVNDDLSDAYHQWQDLLVPRNSRELGRDG